ncbi:hypothetical protein ACJX0J_035083, partial [Zea mays]
MQAQGQGGAYSQHTTLQITMHNYISELLQLTQGKALLTQGKALCAVKQGNTLFWALLTQVTSCEWG